MADTFSAADYRRAAEAQGLRALPLAQVYWSGPAATCTSGHQLLRRDWHWPAARLKAKPFWK